jgi:hypothetical protein
MKSRIALAFVFLVALLAPQLVQAQATSRVIPFNNVPTTIAPSTPGQPLVIQLWDASVGGNQVFNEAQTLDVDANGNISFILGAQTPGGLDPNKFSSGASLFLDVVDATNTSVLPNGRVALNAVAFALSPGPAGPQGPAGPKGDPGAPGVVQAVTAGDTSISIGGNPANTTVAVAANGITNANVADAALSPGKIAGIAATLGPNMFSGNQSVLGSVSVVGNLNMTNSGAAAGNILKSGNLFLHNFGTDNTFLGQSAGNLTMTGVGNTAIGAATLTTNTTGINNTASGFAVLGSNTMGSFNTASGAFALDHNTTGNFNTASGFQALVNNNGDSNTASGSQALQSNTSGSFNTATGGSALLSNTTGTGNTASGFQALLSNTGGTGNTAIGGGALSHNTTGSQNTALGGAADVPVGSNLTNATAIGYDATVNASNKIRLGNTFVTVVETSGKVVASGGFNGACTTVFVPIGGGNIPIFCNQDVAETFASAEATEPGDLVVLVNQTSSMPTVRKSARPYESLLVGAVSTSPGLVFDRGETHLAGDNSRLITSEKTVVGLVGRVPVKVSLENGPIAVGDPLTSSSTAGVAMKANRAGHIIGYALEKAEQKGKILVHLQPGYYIPPKQLALLNQIDELEAQVSELQGLDTQALAHATEMATVKAENAELKARLEKLERAVGSHVLAAKAE